MKKKKGRKQIERLQKRIGDVKGRPDDCFNRGNSILKEWPDYQNKTSNLSGK
jgi:hypothetical protein